MSPIRRLIDWLRSPSDPLAFLAFTNAAVHLALVDRYGYFRDEFYYVACGRHLAWGYVDQPPVIAVISRIALLAGNSLLALRVLPILAGSAVIWLAGLLAREMDGGPFAETLAALCVIAAPVYLFLFHILSMNVFDVLWWTLSAFILLRILKGADPRLWLAFGLVAGIGLLTKYSMGLFLVGVAAGLLLTRERRHFASRWIWLGALLAGLLFLPHVLWEAAHGWPTLEFMRAAEAGKNLKLSPLAFLKEQMLLLNPFLLPVWAAGLGYALFNRAQPSLRVFGIAWLAVLGILLVQASKPYYLAPVYPILFASGAVALERWTGMMSRWLRSASLAPPTSSTRWFRGGLLLYCALAGAVLAPMTLPILPEPKLVRYLRTTGIQASSGERARLGALPQYFADMHGWPEMVAVVADVYNGLPAGDRARCAIVARNYGEAGAIDLLGRKHGLPGAISGHNNYFLWGPRGYAGDVAIMLDRSGDELRSVFGSVERAAVFTDPWCMPFEDSLSVFVCRDLNMPLAQLWPQIKLYR